MSGGGRCLLVNCAWPKRVASAAVFALLSPHGSARAAAVAPPDYAASVRSLKESRFGENDVKAFVHHVFALYDAHADVDRFLPLLADDGLDMRFPEARLRSHQDFKRWYAGVGEAIESNLHQVERVDVKALGSGRFQADIIVLWRALSKADGYVSFRARQTWTLDGRTKGPWPRILTYFVEEAPR